MAFYCIGTRGKHLKSIEALKNSALSRGIDFHILNPNFLDTVLLKNISSRDMVFRLTNSHNSQMLEAILIGKGAISLLRENGIKTLGRITLSALINKIDGISVPRTEFLISNNRKVLINQVKNLGGYPLVIKILGKSMGIGVIKVNSEDTLFSLVDHLKSVNERFILREFINTKLFGRLYVLNEKVILSETNESINDFRSNDAKYFKFQFNEQIENESIKAVKSIGSYFGGVDVLIDQHDKFFILEVNYPCNFITAQINTGIKISDHLIDFMKSKVIE